MFPDIMFFSKFLGTRISQMSSFSRFPYFSGSPRHPRILKCPVFSIFMFFLTVLGTPDFSDVPFSFRISCFFCEFLGSPEFLKCPVFPGYHLEYCQDVLFVLENMEIPLRSGKHSGATLGHVGAILGQ